MTAVAITGMACRFPGASDLSAYWELIRAGTVVGGPVSGRWGHEPFHRPHDPRDPDGAYTDQVAHLDDVRLFGALHYGLPPRRVEVMDPQQRLLIELTRVALQDAGLELRDFPRKDTGVYIGASLAEYRDLLVARIRARQLAHGEFGPVDAASAQGIVDAGDGVADMRAYTMPGTMLNMAAAAVSSTFDLGGPSFVIDAACAAALAAVHEAVTGLRAGHCDLALAGGVYLNLLPDTLIGFSRIGAVSRAGVCRPFDSRADGFVLGEGAGIAVLKRLDDARRDGDRVYAVIRGSACANDGRSTGPMTPRREGQVACLERAYRDAGVPAHSVGFVECHGTATPAGDAVEISSLRDLWPAQRGSRPCYLSSVKANIGHTMSAAGIAGFIKAALVVHHGTVPPQPSCEQADPGLGLDGSPFAVATAPVPWPDEPGTPRRAGVSAFGFGGTNVHVVLEQAPVPVAGQDDAEGDRERWFFLTAGTVDLLGAHAAQLARALRTPGPPRAADIAHTLAARAPLPTRAVVSAVSVAELLVRLDALATAVRDRTPLPAGTWAWYQDTQLATSAGPLPLAAHLAQSLPVGEGRLVHLPANDIRTDSYWGLDQPEPADRGDPVDAVDPRLTEQLMAAIARVSDFPTDVLRPDQALVNDLGFDSLLTEELAEQLASTWPTLPALPDDLLRSSTTVLEVAAWVAENLRSPVPEQAVRRDPDPDPVTPVAGTGDIATQLGLLGLPSPYFTVHDGVMDSTSLVGGVRMTNFSGYDYLGLAGDPAVTSAAKAAIDRYGTSVSASRAASGERPVHGELEAALARHMGSEQALVFVSGHATNVAVLSHLLGPGDLILHDALAHNSIVQGAQLSRARRRAFPHNDLAALDRLLGELGPHHRQVLVAVEGVYSMDGDLVDLPALIALRRRHNFLLFLDEAHSIGVLGATGGGAVEHWGVAAQDVDIRMGTLSKALSSCGGYIAGSDELVTHLRHTTPGFLYSVGMAPASAAAALAALQRLQAEPQLAESARQRAELFRGLAREAGLNTGLSSHPATVVPVITGDAPTALRLADRLRRRGINVQPFIPPAVEDHQSRLRFFLTARHSEQAIARAVEAIAAETAELAAQAGLAAQTVTP